MLKKEATVDTESVFQHLVKQNVFPTFCLLGKVKEDHCVHKDNQNANPENESR